MKRKEIIKKLTAFRSYSDKMSDDLFDLSIKILDITGALESKSRTSEEDALYAKLSDLTQIIMKATLNSNKYNESLINDYMPVLKSLSSDSEWRD